MAGGRPPTQRLIEHEIDVALREGELERAALVSTTMANLADAEVVALAAAMWRHDHAKAEKAGASRKRTKLKWMYVQSCCCGPHVWRAETHTRCVILGPLM